MLTSLIDSHCHLHMLDLAEFSDSLDAVMQQAKAHDVAKMLSVCVTLADLPQLHAIAERYPDVVFTSVGIHPNDVLQPLVSAETLVDLASHPSCVALGETGLDYYRCQSDAEQALQGLQFRQHIQAALAAEKPLIIHTRHASRDTMQIMREEHADKIGGVMHCFAEDWEVARQALELNFYISFSGILTFKNAIALQDLAKKIPIDRLLIETDAPYLAPAPLRGKQNHPALVRYVAQQLAQLRGVDCATIAQHTSANFFACFRLPSPACLS